MARTIPRPIRASGSGVTAHSELTGLLNDDHPQYSRTDGTRTITGNQEFQGHIIVDSSGSYMPYLSISNILSSNFLYTPIIAATTINVSGLVDGRDISADGAAIDALDIRMDNVSGSLNSALLFTGMSNGNDNSPIYLSNYYIANGNSLESAIGKLDTILHEVSSGSTVYHANLQGLLADDHLQYARTDGTRNITGNQIFEGDIVVNASGSVLASLTVVDSTNIGGTLYVAGNERVTGYITNISSGSLFNTLTIVNNLQVGSVIDFSPTTGPVYKEGRLFYDNDRHTLTLYPDVSDCSLQIGQETWMRVRNNTGVTIPDGIPVYIDGAIGNRPTIVPAIATLLSSATVAGITTHSIEDNTDGYITTMGDVRGIDTSDFAEGDLLYLSHLVAGEYINYVPAAPYYCTPIGVVEISNPATGVLGISISSPHLGSGSLNQIMGVNVAGTAEEYKTISGTTNEVTVTHAANLITVGLEPDIVVDTIISSNSGSVFQDLTVIDSMYMRDGVITISSDGEYGSTVNVPTIEFSGSCVSDTGISSLPAQIMYYSDLVYNTNKLYCNRSIVLFDNEAVLGDEYKSLTCKNLILQTAGTGEKVRIDFVTVDQSSYFEAGLNGLNLYCDGAVVSLFNNSSLYSQGYIATDGIAILNNDYISGDEDSTLYFNGTGSGSQYISWDYGEDSFIFSKRIMVPTIMATASGSIFNALRVDTDLTVLGDMAISSIKTIGGTCDVAGNLLSDGDIYCNSLVAESAVYAQASGSLFNTFTVENEATVGTELRVVGTSYLRGIVYNQISGSIFRTLTTADDLLVGNNARVIGNLNVNGNILNTAGIFSTAYVEAHESLYSDHNLYLGYDQADADQYIYFHETSNTGRYLKWSDTSNRFEFNDDIYTSGIITTVTSGSILNSLKVVNDESIGANLYVAGNAQVTGTITAYTSGSAMPNLLISDRLIANNFSTPNALVINAPGYLWCEGSGKFYGNLLLGNSEEDRYIYFYEDSSVTGEYLKWANSGDRFEFSDDLYVGGLVECTSFRIDVTPTSGTFSATHYITISCNGTNYKIPIAAA